jgi:hypothetical protein
VLHRGEDGWWTAKVLTAAASPGPTTAPGSKPASTVGTKGSCPYNYLTVYQNSEEAAVWQKFGINPSTLPWEGLSAPSSQAPATAAPGVAGAAAVPPPPSFGPPAGAVPVNASVRNLGAAPPAFAAPPPPPAPGISSVAALKKPAVTATTLIPKPTDDWGTADPSTAASSVPSTSAASAVAMRAPTATHSEFDAWAASGALSHKPHHGPGTTAGGGPSTTSNSGTADNGRPLSGGTFDNW